MAKLAAYYQEDFHYAPAEYIPRQRKAACFLYDKPENHFLDHSYVRNGHRLRALASSEPVLFPSLPSTLISEGMSLNGRSIAYYPAIPDNPAQRRERLQSICESQMPENYGYRPDVLHDYEQIHPHNENMFENSSVMGTVGSKARERLQRRLSFNDSWDSDYHSPELHTSRLSNRPNLTCGFDPYIEDPLTFTDEYIDRTEDSSSYPPVSYRSDSSHDKWQQWSHSPKYYYSRPVLLPPPSPLDSGLSSQSITSSPSLDAEPIHNGRIRRHHGCCCSRMLYTDNGHFLPSELCDSGGNSPVVHPMHSPRTKKSVEPLNNNAAYIDNNFEEEYRRSQVRYGKLGILGEPLTNNPRMTVFPVVPNENCRRKFVGENDMQPAVYKHVDDKGVVKAHVILPSSTGPSVIITEASEKSTQSSSSPDQDHSDKSPEPESSVSLAVSSNSTSKSSSVNSISNELNEDELRKTNREAEKDIREIEEMYNQCSLIDYDLFELPDKKDKARVRQTRIDQINSRLTRSKSDTLYEITNPIYNSPYEKLHRDPPIRRKGEPDTVADDMATRKFCKPVTTSSFNPADSTVTYMLCSSHFTPTVPAPRDILLADNPDIEYDDLCYRRHYHGKKSKIPDPQPPFGIPLRPPPPQQVKTNYLHVVPNTRLQPLCHPRGHPDVVRDDLAFRALRKDEPERLYYDVSMFYNKKRG